MAKHIVVVHRFFPQAVVVVEYQGPLTLTVYIHPSIHRILENILDKSLRG